MNASEVLQMMDHKYALFGLFFAFHNRLQAVGDSFYEEITCKQFFLMACMNLYQDEAPTANELAKTMGCTRQNVKEILNSLEKKQLIRLETDERDKRKQRVYLTENAQLMADKYRKKETDFMNYLYEGISEEEVDSAYSIITKIEDNSVEIKSVEKLLPVHSKQLKTYLKLSQKRVGLLINFGENNFADGIKRIVLDYDDLEKI